MTPQIARTLVTVMVSLVVSLGLSARSVPAQTVATPVLTGASPGERCGTPGEAATALLLTTDDGVTLNAATLGDGSVAVIIAHEYPANYCNGWRYALHLRDEGYRVLLFDFRCFGLSTCPTTLEAQANLVADLDAAIDDVHRDGIDTVFLLGASMGGSAVLEAAASIRPPVSGVVSLSGEVDLGAFLPDLPLRPIDTIGQVVSPLLVVTSDRDPYLSVTDAEALVDGAASTDKRLVVVRDSGLHGFNLLLPSGGVVDVDAEILDFLRDNAIDSGSATPTAGA